MSTTSSAFHIEFCDLETLRTLFSGRRAAAFSYQGIYLTKLHPILYLSDMAGQLSIDPYKLMHVIRNPDGTLTRLPIPSTTTEDHNSLPNQSVFTKDIPLNLTHKTSLRLYKPINTPPHTKLPLMIYIHGGGFVTCSASSNVFHDFCTSMASQLSVFVVSLDYRLAPENRLPAAYDDAMDAIKWVNCQALAVDGDAWLKDAADFSNAYVMGVSAGGNISYHAGLRALSLGVKPLVIRGFILNHPYFSGLQRTQSEMRLAHDDSFPLVVSDLMWELSLPVGSNRDHEYCNPLVDGSSKDKIGFLRRCFVTVGGRDILMDRQMEFIKMLEESGASVVTWFIEDGKHGADTLDTENHNGLFVALKEFLSSVDGVQ